MWAFLCPPENHYTHQPPSKNMNGNCYYRDTLNNKSLIQL